jgi:hypothetical protein
VEGPGRALTPAQSTYSFVSLTLSGEFTLSPAIITNGRLCGPVGIFNTLHLYILQNVLFVKNITFFYLVQEKTRYYFFV